MLDPRGIDEANLFDRCGIVGDRVTPPGLFE